MIDATPIASQRAGDEGKVCSDSLCAVRKCVFGSHEHKKSIKARAASIWLGVLGVRLALNILPAFRCYMLLGPVQEDFNEDQLL